MVPHKRPVVSRVVEDRHGRAEVRSRSSQPMPPRSRTVYIDAGTTNHDEGFQGSNESAREWTTLGPTSTNQTQSYHSGVSSNQRPQQALAGVNSQFSPLSWPRRQSRRQQKLEPTCLQTSSPARPRKSRSMIHLNQNEARASLLSRRPPKILASTWPAQPPTILHCQPSR